MKAHFITHSRRYITLALLGVFFNLIILFFFYKSFHIYAICNSLFVVGFLMICSGGLIYVSNQGGFDTFSYSTGMAIKVLSPKVRSHQKNTLHDFVESKAEKRKKQRYDCIPYLLVGLLQVLIALLIVIIL